MKGKRKQIARTKAAALQQKLMNRFIREIEREEPLESDILNSMFVYQPIRVIQ